MDIQTDQETNQVTYTAPNGNKYQINREKSSSLFFMSPIGKGGKLPTEFNGSFTAHKFIHEAIGKYESRPKVETTKKMNEDRQFRKKAIEDAKEVEVAAA